MRPKPVNLLIPLAAVAAVVTIRTGGRLGLRTDYQVRPVDQR